MGVENIEKQNSVSQEQMEKFEVILSTMTDCRNSYNSDEMLDEVEAKKFFLKNFEKKGRKPEDYLLFRVLLKFDDISLSSHLYYDTEDGEIQKFIESLIKQHEEYVKQKEKKLIKAGV